MKSEFLITRQGKQHVLYAGLLDEAHQRGLKEIQTELLQAPTEENGMVAICNATVALRDPEETSADGTPLAQVYQGIGDASPQNVGKMIVPHLIRMAETRAKARALRDAVNVGITALEETGGEDSEVPREVPREAAERGAAVETTRGGATRKAAGKLWHMAKDRGDVAAFEEKNGAIQDMDARTVSAWINHFSEEAS